MKLRILYIVGGVMLSVMIVTISILGIMQTNYGLNLANPSHVNIYKNNTTVTSSYSANDEEYSKIIQLYNEMTEKTILRQLLEGRYLDKLPSEDLNQAAWYELKKVSGIYIEFVYDNPQKLIISRNGSTRRIDIKAIIFKAGKSYYYEDLLIYYRTSETYETQDSQKETVYPITVNANTNDLFNYLVK